jgi:hypothetical protein
MTEQIRELAEETGIGEEDARARLQDADLWLLPPGQRFDEELQGEEGVHQWEEAAIVARTAADMVSGEAGTVKASAALTQLLWDTALRAEEALERARQRV